MPTTPLFWLVALLLVAATVAALVWPLLRTRNAATGDVEETGPASLYRDQKRQLDAELAAGAISPAEHATGQDELAARLGAELTPAAAPPPPTRAPFVAAVAVAGVLPVLALALYAALGHPDSMRATPAANASIAQSPSDIAALVDKLAARMREHPEDPTGWKLLARAYAAMGRYDDAAAAFAEAAARSPREDAALLTDWADALAMKNQSLDGKPAELVARALALEPTNAKALALSASAAFDRKDYEAAITQWRKLGAQFPQGSDAAREIDTMIAEAETARGGATDAAKAQRVAPAAGSAPGSATAAATPAASSITGKVALDPALRDRTSADDTLYIFARAVDGPRMPLAVVRARASELPRAFTLDDSMAMSNDHRLSTASSVVVEARISRTGSANPSPGDLQGRSAPLKPGARDVSIVIDDVVR